MASSKDKRTYHSIKEHGQDMSYENEVIYDVDDRGSSDLTRQVDELKKEVERLKKEIDILTDRQTIELLQKDKDLEIKDKEIGRLMKKVNDK